MNICYQRLLVSKFNFLKQPSFRGYCEFQSKFNVRNLSTTAAKTMNFVQFQKNDNCQVRTGLKKNDGTIVELLLRGKPASMLSLLGSGELENLDYLNW